MKKTGKVRTTGSFYFHRILPPVHWGKKSAKKGYFPWKVFDFWKISGKRNKKVIILLPKKDCYFCILHSVNCDLSREKDIFLWTMGMISFVLGDAKRDLSGS